MRSKKDTRVFRESGVVWFLQQWFWAPLSGAIVAVVTSVMAALRNYDAVAVTMVAIAVLALVTWFVWTVQRIFVLRSERKWAQDRMDPTQAAPGVKAKDEGRGPYTDALPPKSGTIVGGNVRLSALVTPDDALIENVTFTGVTLLGPAIATLSHPRFDDRCLFPGATSHQDVIVEVYQRQKRAVGAIALRNCTFIGCTFWKISFIAKKDEAAKIRQLIRFDAPKQPGDES